MAKNKSKKWNWRVIIGVILFVSLALSIVFTIVSMILAPEQPLPEEPHRKVKGDYTLMLVQCALGLVVMFLPSMLEKKLRLEIPNYIFVLYFIFLYCAIYLGEVRNYYYLVPHWDTILHTFSGAMLGALGFTLVDILNRNERVPIRLSPFFVAFFAFCFALAAGAVWEIYEFTFDGVLGLNMQKFALEDGTQLIGRAALTDTMKDLIVDALGAIVLVVLGYIQLKQAQHKEKRKNQGQA